MSVQLEGALAVVTGGGSGIGRATALALARRGAQVVVIDMDGDAATEVATSIDGVARSLDVSDPEATTRVARELEREVGVPDLLVNNAGVGHTGRFLATTLDDWHWILGTNLMGVVHGCRAFGPAMLDRGSGHVVNVSSGLAYTPRATEPAYVTSKAAVLALTRCLRADWGPKGVGVSAICPGVIATSIVERGRFRGERASAEAMARVRRGFARGHPPMLVAEAVVDAVERDRPVVPVGIEARVGWVLHGLVPSRLVDRAARTSIAGL
jgi:NAD(P)-dependent dehydrogenase (short-subunit alcohol dehydrogenase family)